ncbi:trans-1,2-dihydrobenzene-1,2-diol dehydrogenase-like [Salarias fasciatus]|uniref:Trans-1,2-dihydrobenzene-1,2-diol dehydrogenase n=1 Tax=Salarias fasciatus TaxID=181472 RepID=A0A672INJ7_SALFA|nr:trans-1,2-dihydrobenzene-1,2-diol dehydrogenase-like [Salarias fasciatus]
MATRWAICGAGKISHDFCVALRTLPAEHHQIVAVAARKLADAQEFAKKHNIPTAYGSYEELAKDPNFDVVYIGVINPYHLQMSLLFTNAKKNVLCEKPLGMNSREVRQILDSAKKNNVFFMEAIWTRFFPVSVEIRRLLEQGELGDVRMIRAEFGLPLLHSERVTQKELGGGVVLDIGIYPLQFILMAFNGEKPESIQASGVFLENGVDETVIVTMKFSQGRMASLICSSRIEMPNEAVIAGTKGIARVPNLMWCPTILEVNGKRTEYPLPQHGMPYNFDNAPGMSYEAEAVRQCLLKGLKECSVMSHADSVLLAEVEDEIRRQIGSVYSQDKV